MQKASANIQRESNMGYMALGIFVLTYPAMVLAIRGAANGFMFAAVAVCLGVLAARRLTDRENRSAWAPLDRLDASYCGAMACPILAILLSEIWHGHIAAYTLDSPTRFLLAIPLFVVLRHGARRGLRWADLSFAFGAIGAAIMIIPGSLGNWGSGRADTWFLNPIHLGDIALILGVLSALSINWWQKDHWAVRGLKILGTLAGLTVSLLTQSRGGWVALPVIGALLLYVGLRGKSWQLKLAISLLVVIALVSPYWISSIVHQRFDMIHQDIVHYFHGQRDTSVGVRFQLWEAALELLKEHPLLGPGASGFKHSMTQLAAKGVISPLVDEMGHAETHNQVLAFAADYGLVGALAILSIYVAPCLLFRKYLRSPDRVARRAALMGLAFVIGFFVFGLTVETFDLKMTAAFYATTMTILAAIAAHAGTVEK